MRTIKTKSGEVAGFVASFNELSLSQQIQARPFVIGAWGPAKTPHEHFDRANQMEFVLARLSGRITVVDARMP
jgi:hypothetical protein